VPRTAIARSADEALSRAPALGWPVVLKPVASRLLGDGKIERFKVAYADSPDSLARGMARFADRCPVLLQEYCAGEGQGVELLLDRGRPLMAFQHRRLHEVPITGGASSLRESVPLDPRLLAHAARLLQELAWTGLAMVEFRVGPADPVLMEVNGRVWGSLPLAVKSGVDFPVGLAALYLGPRLNGAGTPGRTQPVIGVRSRDLGLELVWIASVLRRRRRYPFLTVPRRRDGVAAALRLPLRRDGFDVLCADDPAPGIADVARATRNLFRKVGHAT
jgi:hypothetical protein